MAWAAIGERAFLVVVADLFARRGGRAVETVASHFDSERPESRVKLETRCPQRVRNGS